MIVTLDFYNSNFYINCSGREYLWNSEQEFLEQTLFPYTETKLLSLEPHRNIYHLEKADGTFTNYDSAPEISWFLEREIDLEHLIQSLPIQGAPVITGLSQRAQLLFDTDWLIQRHQEEILRETSTTLSIPQFQTLLNYRQELRDLTINFDLTQPAETIAWPPKPFNF